MHIDTLPCLTTAMFDPKPYEVDFTGYLSNTVAVRWMEDLRVKMMRDHFGEFDTGKPENLSVIVKAEICYLRPIHYGDQVEGVVWVGRVLPSQWQVNFEFMPPDRSGPLLTATQTGAFVNAKTLSPVRVPKSIANRIVRQ